jgi:hypothetical protein
MLRRHQFSQQVGIDITVPAWLSCSAVGRHHHVTRQSNLTWYWNTSVCFSSFLIQGLVAQRLRFNLNEQKQTREDLAKALEQQKLSAAEIQKLQSQLQAVCAWRHRIKIEGRWVTMEEFLKTSFISNWHTGFLRKPSRRSERKNRRLLNRSGLLSVGR